MVSLRGERSSMSMTLLGVFFSSVRADAAAGGDISSSQDMCSCPEAEAFGLFFLILCINTHPPPGSRPEVSILCYVTIRGKQVNRHVRPNT